MPSLIEMPINCPICNGPLLNNFKEMPYGKPYAVEKTCFTASHKFLCSSTKGNEDEVCFISLSLDPYKKMSANWVVLEKKLYVYGKGNSENENSTYQLKTTYIPYIEPDFSEPMKLINKIKLYTKFL